MTTRLLLTVLTLLTAAGASADSSDPKVLKVCLVSGSEEYNSDASLAAFQAYLESNYPARSTLLKAKGFGDLPGLEALDDCDVALFFTRRLTISGDQLERVKRYATSGRPLVALRTASHGFQNWLEFDKLVLGGNYHNHLRNDLTMRAKAVGEAKGHPVLDGVGMIASRGSLYRTSPIASDATLLMTGTSPEGTEPATWAREFHGGRVVYTSLGAQGDFENASYLRLLANALFWAARRDVPRPPEPAPARRATPSGSLRLTLRSRARAAGSDDQWALARETREVPVARTAIIICDMWDKHWCGGASERCDAIAARMARVIDAARAKGIQIVHAPSECMDFYAGTAQRRRMQRAPRATPPKVLDISEPPLPIDDSDGGCDTGEAMYLAWTRQNSRIHIAEPDGISDNGDEVYNFLREQGIDTVLVMGVHTNMCILGRSFAIRALTKRGLQCILVRDLTDAMYNPARRPNVSHDRGTELVIEHIEKYWAPSTTSDELAAGLPK